MARGGITYLDVAKTAENLKNKGIIPTIDRVREVLGTGSKTTLAHHLKRWKAITPEELNYQTIPAELVQSVKNLHEQLKAHAQQKIEELKQRSQQEINQLLQQVNQERENIGILKRNILNLETSNNKSSNQIKDLETLLAASKQSNVDLTTEKNTIAARLQEKIEQIATLKEQLKSIENNSDHYREMLNQQRNDEKMQFAQQLKLLQEENNAYKVKIQHIEQQYTNKLAEKEIISNKLLTAIARQEELINNFINPKNTIRKAKKKEVVAAYKNIRK
jgi:DNA repair exonuclease SbcCD ATPase subunit